MKQVLGIDVGGTKVASGLVAEGCQVSDFRIESTSQADLVGQLGKLIGSYQGFEGIGLGLPGQVLADGRVTKLPNIESFGETSLRQALEDQFHLPVHVMNDAKAFALAEATFGAGQGYRTVVGLILGTGTGAGLVIDKQLHLGKDGIAGEFDHVMWLDGKLFRDQVKLQKPFNRIEEACQYLRTILSLVVLGYNPDIIVLGGGWSNMPGLQAQAQEFLTNVGGYQNQTPVVMHQLDHPGIIGAALPLLRR
ncbi:MAG: hypothetical protein A3J07_01225 [Candidatus Doudnabacteria bacterium RIFCSPLOWO2_02_FULL_49_13]|uniref:ROK family protein n=1 Tax=Candidatus Doudnabacteria bacterium RIFCSPHIGHO2_12_FULL_48_16 TaxID=1817838 RepID=A0A1F5PKD7_9BACT|nr:MAG: hypothetical protein A3B77_04155 [Candidatus Doudnabacteria bacterium RIFCSPHIGHO2_02_FULL_49_24]OGE88676.1 MAG: hypothetical protein A2760_01815 [Candidatus Doudnabacteria bacterium RIFCSPHIGHO2_01_FULL_50_67]OGE90361.1 MAG: hypothetical protein A3E29_04735 [Candidatus Doudnabacteria bacterium RIFCSPHIGHO2_12_FULL_48_16]OGE97068.1 MAG: hypothetical protein A2990_01725 [Candidatus Doudnabacteria bacterium RIFCSPLOWO2_01_FULL_49_40]OGF02417.1 MAG: hypothetical protein A3J07_01225 [Candid